jgi:ribosome biogenesis GTPase
MSTNLLESFGWNTEREVAFRAFESRGLLPARIIEERRASFLAITAAGEGVFRLAGSLRHGTTDPLNLPCVGDWVAVEPPSAGGSEGVIHGVLPRTSLLARKVADRAAEGRALASNIDTAFLVTSAHADLNLPRVARSLALLWESGAQPVALLTKVDLVAEDGGAALASDLAGAAPGVPVHALSAKSGIGFEALDAHLRPGTTSVLLGSSGVGKSTLVNRLLGEVRQPVREIRATDGRGMHTTTARHLFLLPSGAALVDTPGIREVAMFGASDGLDAAFADVALLAEGCRFRDCMHGSEPGCAVRGAVDAGALPAERLDQWHHLRRESAFWERKTDARARAEERRRVRRFGKIVREATAERKRRRG